WGSRLGNKMVPDGPGSSIDVREFHKVFRILIMDGLNCTWKKMGHCLFAVEAIAIHPVPEVSHFLSLTDKMDSLNPSTSRNLAKGTCWYATMFHDMTHFLMVNPSSRSIKLIRHPVIGIYKLFKPITKLVPHIQ